MFAKIRLITKGCDFLVQVLVVLAGVHKIFVLGSVFSVGSASETAKWREVHAGEQSRIFAAWDPEISATFWVSRQYHWFSAICFLHTKQVRGGRGSASAATGCLKFGSIFKFPSVARPPAGSWAFCRFAASL